MVLKTKTNFKRKLLVILSFTFKILVVYAMNCYTDLMKSSTQENKRQRLNRIINFVMFIDFKHISYQEHSSVQIRMGCHNIKIYIVYSSLKK